MKTLFRSEQNKANCTFGAASSSCAFSITRVLGTVLAVSIIIFAIISHSVICISIISIISIIWLMLSAIINEKNMIKNEIGYSQKNSYAAA